MNLDKKNIHIIMNYWRGASKALEMDLKEISKESGITSAEQHLLWILYFEGEATISVIAELGLWDRSTVMQVVKRLESKGIVQVKKNQLDRRVSYVSLTSKGYQLREDTEKYDYTILKFINRYREKKGDCEILSSLHDFLRELNMEVHGEEFVNWVEKTSDRLV